jgi:hypothetical protein
MLPEQYSDPISYKCYVDYIVLAECKSLEHFLLMQGLSKRKYAGNRVTDIVKLLYTISCKFFCVLWFLWLNVCVGFFLPRYLWSPKFGVLRGSDLTVLLSVAPYSRSLAPHVDLLMTGYPGFSVLVTRIILGWADPQLVLCSYLYTTTDTSIHCDLMIIVPALWTSRIPSEYRVIFAWCQMEVAGGRGGKVAWFELWIVPSPQPSESTSQLRPGESKSYFDL